MCTPLRSPVVPKSVPGNWNRINARHLRYHYQLWNDLRPKTRARSILRWFTHPQLGYSLTPHIS
jgi:hypothetical protein